MIKLEKQFGKALKYIYEIITSDEEAVLSNEKICLSLLLTLLGDIFRELSTLDPIQIQLHRATLESSEIFEFQGNSRFFFLSHYFIFFFIFFFL